MISSQFFGGSDVFKEEPNGEKFLLKIARLCDWDNNRLRALGDALPHAVYANPALAEAKKRGISLAETGKVKPIEPIFPTEKELLGAG
jgi:hypothetical protein